MDKPTWSLILDAAQELGDGGAEFSRAALVDAVIRRDPRRRADSIGPVIQGMTRNAAGGPPSPCGTPLERVSHGWYRLASTQLTPTPARLRLPAATRVSPPAAGQPPASAAVDLVLVGCVKTKADEPQAARDLYRSPLFERRRRYAEQHGTRWYIISAEHGLVTPDALLEPYDTALAEQGEEYRRAWGQWVVAKLRRVEGDLRGKVIEIHAGDAYVAPLRQPLSAAGAVVRHPVAGLRQGEHLSWYDRPAPAPSAEPASSPANDAASMPGAEPGATTALFADLTLLDGPHPARPFIYRWPDQSESFDTGWNLVVAEYGTRYSVKIGLGTQVVYGQNRRHLVIWVGSEALAEAVGEDAHATTRCLAGLLKDADGLMVRPEQTVPPTYSGFPIVRFADVVSGPYTRGGLAVRLPEDDILGWTTFALARLALRAGPRRPARADVVPSPRQPASTYVADASRRTLVEAILRYGRDHKQDNIGRQPQFTPHAEANQFLLDNPFAFLLAVVLDQGIPAERAWRGPYDLRLRLGHLDPARIAAQPTEVAAAVARPPALHRFTTNMASWLVAAGSKVSSQYHGDAGAIWAGNPRAADLAARLAAFPGIGQKKSAMAVEILARDMGVPMRDLTGSDIAYDVHVRRVFLRTGLAERDDLDHMVGVARRFHPERPGELDFPTWLIGRQWCGPGTPDCPRCVLHSVCPKHVDRAAGVSGS